MSVQHHLNQSENHAINIAYVLDIHFAAAILWLD